MRILAFLVTTLLVAPSLCYGQYQIFGPVGGQQQNTVESPVLKTTPFRASPGYRYDSTTGTYKSTTSISTPQPGATTGTWISQSKYRYDPVSGTYKAVTSPTSSTSTPRSSD